MSKNAHFSGQPIFSQLLNLIDKSMVSRQANQFKSDRYYKSFKTYHHLVTMLYTIFHKCTSLREAVTGMQVCHQKLNHLGLDYCPRRSTFSDANKNRPYEVFEAIYKQLYNRFHNNLADSRSKRTWFKRLFIVDSTTISLFKEILKNAGRSPVNGKRKGGIKVHALIKADEDIPCLVRMNAAASHDLPFIKGMKLTKGSIIVFDKGYNDYRQYDLWTKEKVDWVTRLRKGAIYEVIEEKQISEKHKNEGILKDEIVIIGHQINENVTRTKARRIEYHDKVNDRHFTFITNNLIFVPTTIALIYKQRWQIEMVFKRLKQNYPLQYFLGDNENAIKIQIWCALIADLILKVVKNRVKRSWSFSHLSSMIRIHLMTYTKLFDFLEKPDNMLINYIEIDNKGPTLFG